MAQSQLSVLLLGFVIFWILLCSRKLRVDQDPGGLHTPALSWWVITVYNLVLIRKSGFSTNQMQRISPFVVSTDAC